MTPEKLIRPFIGISFTEDDYLKIRGLLPTPTFQDTLVSHDAAWVRYVYVLDDFYSSSKEYKHLSDIKLGMKKLIFTPIGFIDFFYINDQTQINGITYSLLELSNAFKCEYVPYPKIFFPATKKELYRYLILHGKKLRYERVFTQEAMIATALMMNKHLTDKMIDKDVHKKALAAYRFIKENKQHFKEKLSKKKLKEAHSKGAAMTNQMQTEKTKERIAALLKDEAFIKPNGKVNKTALANALNVHRKTLDRYL